MAKAQPVAAVRERGDDDSTMHRVWRVGRTAWALLGVLGALVVLGYVASRLSLVVVPVVLALFPATLLVPLARWLNQHGVPAALAALGAILAGILLIVGVIVGMVPVVAAELPQLAQSASEGVAQIQQLLQQVGVDVGGVDEILATARKQVGQAGNVAGRAAEAAVAAVETLASLLLLIVILFFYLKDGPRLANGIISTAPRRARPAMAAIADRAWETLGSYFRGQLLIALVDAVLIGVGLLILGIPLAVPLTVLVFFGGLFPIVGAIVSGTLAVLVALAHAGLTTGLIVLGVVIAVQQIEGNVLEPLILGHAIELHPLVVLLSIAAGAVLLGVLGAFLAVPVAAILARAIQYLRGEEADDDDADDRASQAATRA